MTLHALEIMGVRIERFRYVDYMGSVWILYFFHGESLRYFSFPFSNVLMSLSPFVMSLPDAFLRFSLRNVNKVTKKVFTLHFVT